MRYYNTAEANDKYFFSISCSILIQLSSNYSIILAILFIPLILVTDVDLLFHQNTSLQLLEIEYPSSYLLLLLYYNINEILFDYLEREEYEVVVYLL